MLKEFLQSISGPISSVAYTYPTGTVNGGPSVSPGGFFNKILNVLSSGAYGGNSGNSLGVYAGMQSQNMNSSVQSYVNSLNTYSGVHSGSKKSSRREAFAPGSVINILQAPPAPQAVPAGYAPLGQLTGGINPLQGFAGQSGAAAGITGGLPGSYGAGGMAGVMNLNGFSPMGNAGGSGKLSMLLMPVLSLVGLVKSLFGLRGLTNSEKVAHIDKNDLDYMNSLENYQVAENTDGSFDEEGYWDGEEVGGDNSFDISKLEM